MQYFEENCAISTVVAPVKLLTTHYDSIYTTLPHWHKSQEILLVVKGSVTIIINNQKLRALQSDLIILNAFDVHALYGNAVVKVLQFEELKQEGSELDVFAIFSMIETQRILSSRNPYAKLISNEIQNIFNNYSNHDLGHQINSLGCLYKIISYISLYSPESRKDVAISQRQQYASLKLKKLIDYIDENFAQEISLEKAAEIMCLSTNYFCTFFKNSMGMTFLEYLNAFRCEKAENMLKMTDRSITDISFAVGFNSIQYFNRIYKKQYGCSPSVTRNLFLAENLT